MFPLICFSVLIAFSFGAIEEDNSTAIINGDLANIEDFPYYAFLASNNDLHCGGAFIERDLVLTAAHCLGDTSITVYSGITKLRDLRRAKGYEVKSAIPHPEFWLTGDSSVDIGLIKLEEKIKLGAKAQIIGLATEAPPEGEEATVVGFGAVKCVGVGRCHKYHRGSKHLRSAGMIIDDVMEDGIIHTIPHEEKNTCYGDSGGPITYDGKIIGVVSSGEIGDCSGYDIQGPVFTKLDWIKKTAESM